MDTKTIIGTAIAILLPLGAGTIALDLSVETVQEESVRYVSILEQKELKVSKDERKHTQVVKNLIVRRSKGDEPTIEEWYAVETAIDEARAIQDTLYLQKLDHFIERMDAQNKDVRDDAVSKLKL